MFTRRSLCLSDGRKIRPVAACSASTLRFCTRKRQPVVTDVTDVPQVLPVTPSPVTTAVHPDSVSGPLSSREQSMAIESASARTGATLTSEVGTIATGPLSSP